MHVLLDLVGGADLRRDVDTQRIAEEAFGELPDLARHGRGEQQRLPRLRQGGDDRADIADEAEVQHAVGLIQHKMRDLVEQQVARVHQVADAPWRANDDVRAAAHALLLRPAADAAEDDAGEDRLTGGEAADGGVDLQRQFPRRRQDQHTGVERAGPAARGGKVLKDRQREGRGLARAGLRDAEQVMAGEKRRDGAGLDGGGGLKFCAARARRIGSDRPSVAKDKEVNKGLRRIVCALRPPPA